MNFFESQDRVRKNTFLLVFLFSLAVITLIIMTNLLVMVVFGHIKNEQMQGGEALLQHMDWQAFAAVSAGVVAVVLMGSLYKIVALSSGGKAVAESLGGQLIPTNTDELIHRRLLNVVEEMAIASGTPVPPVYLLVNEPGINAFAAGFSPRDAVIGVTQGLVEQLNREQLQGVIAHEFSHIFNGDMRLNIHLMGVLNGILIIGMGGYYLMRSTSFSERRRNNKGSGQILVLAIGLMAIGFAGTFFGNLIKAAVSRQREYLADASAVQFTRNPDGIAGALKRIGGLQFGSKVENPGAPEVSHALFAQGISGFMQSLFATHPPLAKRILSIDPHWNGEFDYSDKPSLHKDEEEGDIKENVSREELAKKVAAVAVGAAMTDVVNAIDKIGNPEPETINYAHSLITMIPAFIKEAAREPYGARAVIYCLVLDSTQEIRAGQLMHLQKYADPNVLGLTYKLQAEMEGLDIKFRLPLIDMAIPALKQLSLDQYQAFRENLVALIGIDARVDLLEWSLQKILFNHLDEHFFKPMNVKMRYPHMRKLKQEMELVLSVMVYAAHQDQNDIEQAFTAAAQTLVLNGLKLVPKTEISFSGLDRALRNLEQMRPLLKPQLLKACAASIAYDKKISSVEIELLRAFSDAIDCPMPPIFVKERRNYETN